MECEIDKSFQAIQQAPNRLCGMKTKYRTTIVTRSKLIRRIACETIGEDMIMPVGTMKV